MGRIARAKVPLYAMVVLASVAGYAWGSISVDSVNDEASIVGGPACMNRTAVAAAWADRPAGGCAADPVVPEWVGGTSINVLDVATGALQTGVNFTRPSSPTINFPVQSSGGGGCGSIDLCNCDSAEIISARVFNSYKRRACSTCGIAGCPTPLTDYQVEQKIGATGTFVVCTGLGNCPDIAPDQTAQAFLRISRTDAGAKCGFLVIREPMTPAGTAGTAFVRLEADHPCGLFTNWAVPTTGNTGTDLNLVNLIQIKRNAINGVVHFDLVPTPGAAPVSFTVDTTGKTNAVVAAEIDTKLEAAGLGLRASVAANAAAAGSVLDTFAGSPYEVGQPVVVVENAGFRVAAIHVKVVTGQEAIMEDLNPDPSVPTLSEWAMIIMALLLVGSGYWLFRRQQRPSLA